MPRRISVAAPLVVGTGIGLPTNVYSQVQLGRLARELFPAVMLSDGALERLFRVVGVEQRRLALPVETYAYLGGLGERNELWLDVAKQLGEQALRSALAEVDLDPAAVAQLMTTTVTGLAVPSLDARLMNRISFSPALERVPLFGLGCVGGAAGVARTADYLRAYPDEAAMLLAVELCSLTFRRDDASLANLISTGLFGDGAAAVLMVGARHPLARRSMAKDSPSSSRGPAILDSRAAFFPDTEAVMGWQIADEGFRIVLGPEIPELVDRELASLIDPLLAANGLERADIATWIAHPGGPKVIRAVTSALGLDDAALEATRAHLATFGNLSSASVLVLLDEFRRRRRPRPGSFGVLFAFGPAFCAEAVLLRW